MIELDCQLGENRMETIKCSNRLPSTRLLPFLSKSELLLVWRDVIYELKNTQLSTNKMPEQYFVYLMLVYLELVNKGSKPNKDYIETHIKNSFCYLQKFDMWVGLYALQGLMKTSVVCNDRDMDLAKKHIHKYLNKDKSLIEVTEKELNKAINNLMQSKDVTLTLIELLNRN